MHKKVTCQLTFRNIDFKKATTRAFGCNYHIYDSAYTQIIRIQSNQGNFLINPPIMDSAPPRTLLLLSVIKLRTVLME